MRTCSPSRSRRSVSAFTRSGRPPTCPQTPSSLPLIDLSGVAYRAAVARSRIRDVQVTLWYFAVCPNWRVAEQHLRQALGLIGDGDADVRLVPVTTEAEAASVGFAGSPTFRVNGVDLFGPPPFVGALTCRMYRTPSWPAGVPEVDDLVAAIRTTDYVSSSRPTPMATASGSAALDPDRG